MRKRLLSLALALALCLGLTVPAAAATITELDPNDKYATMREFSDGLAAVLYRGEGWGYIDISGKFVIPCQYDDTIEEPLMDFSDGAAWVQNKSGETLCLDKTGNVLFTLPEEYSTYGYIQPLGSFSDGLAQVTREGKRGFIDKTGKEVIPCQYSSVKPFSEGLAAVYNSADGVWTYIDKTGNTAIPFQYQKAESFGERYTGYTVVTPMDSERETLIDKTGRDVIPSGYSYYIDKDSAWESGDRYVPLRSSDGKRDSVYDLTTGQIVKFPFTPVSDFHEGLAWAKGDNGDYQLINENYEVIASQVHAKYSDFSGGYALGWYDYVAFVIDQTGREILTIADYDENGKYEVKGFSEGLLIVRVKANNRWGAIDVTGKEVVPCKYEKVEEFHNGVAAVQNFEGKWGLVDTSGNEIKPCEEKHDIYYRDGSIWQWSMPSAGRQSNYKLISISGTAPYSTAAPTTPSTSAKPAGPSANPTNSKVLVNGREVAFDAYTIDGSNYFKLRDLAYVLNGTEKQFEVGWDNASKTITLTSGSAYTDNGSEMAKGGGAQSASVSASKLLIDGKEVSLTAYTIGGNNYFKLRDIGQAFDFGIGWDNATKTITIDTSTGYTA